MEGGIEGVEGWDGQFAGMRRGVKCGGEACKDCCMEGKREVKVGVDGGDGVSGVWLPRRVLGVRGGKGRGGL